MKSLSILLTCGLLFVAPAAGQVIAAPSDGMPTTRPTSPKVVRIAAQPAAAPRPSLSWLLLPPVAEQTPGNAAQLYLSADVLAGPLSTHEERKKIDTWLGLPLSKLPVQPATKLVERYRYPLHEVELASRREYAKWDCSILTEGFHALMPNLGDRMHLAKVLALRARVHLAGGQQRQAVEDLQIGMAMARHTAAGPTLVHCIVATALAAETLERVDELIASPGSPNLYWALTALPRPMIDLTRPMAYERSTLLLAYPELRGLRTGRLSAKRWREITADLRGLMGDPEAAEKRNWQEQLADTLSAAKSYTLAKKALIDRGYPAKKVEAMPVHQVIGMHQFDVYQRVSDDAFRWFHLPYWQAHGPMHLAGDEVHRALVADPGNLYLQMLPSLSRAYFLTTRTDRRIAALRCVEAIRMYAAAHDGRLPGTLADVTEVPLPNDPTTGKAFGYRASGGTCVLTSPAVPGEGPQAGLRYELTIKK